MNNLRFFTVSPKIPKNIKFLEELSMNLWWSWNSNAKNLFRRIDPAKWEEHERNPIAMLSNVPQKRLEDLSCDNGFLKHLRDVKNDFELEVKKSMKNCREGNCVVYFSLEYGLHESIKTYSGGLGILAGDHLKTASDFEFDLIGVGLYYREGYFTQKLNNDGWQEETYKANEIDYLPLKKAKNKDGNEFVIQLNLPDGIAKAIVWRMDIGSTRLYLLDTNIPENNPKHRDITSRLYGGNREMRLRQELLLGVGGFSAIKEMGMDPKVYHINEGHAAFLNIARLNDYMQNDQLSFDEALYMASNTKVFTTHTPVPAGHESFKLDLLKPHLDSVMHQYHFSSEDVFSLAQLPAANERDDSKTELSLTVFALRGANYSNGVSKLHGEVSRDMWEHLWPSHPIEEIPIDHITNGVHLPTWVSDEIALLMERYIGKGWDKGLLNKEQINIIDGILPEELWQAHEVARSRLIAGVREHIRKSLIRKNATDFEIKRADKVLNQNTLTIAFARRFATYKRATLVLKDIERFKKILTNPDYPVQILFSGKAHPADEGGKKLMQQLYELTKDESLHNHIVFLENYEISIAKKMLQGVDIWLNNPRRPREASGTSGMKAALNGVINFSVLDGWWAEAYNEKNGWSIGAGETYDDLEYQDYIESQYLYNTLENEIIPMYYEKKNGNIPIEWVNMMKESIKTILSYFSSHRMVKEYHDFGYQPAHDNSILLVKNHFEQCKKDTSQLKNLKKNWQKIRIEKIHANKDLGELHVGEKLKITAEVFLDDISTDDLDVEVYYGKVSPLNTVLQSTIEPMKLEQKRENGIYQFIREIECTASGRYGFTVRVTPSHKKWKNIMPGLITWANVE